MTTHYARYDLHPALFAINFVSLLFLALAPKLPSLHRIRLRFFPDDAPDPISLHATHGSISSRNPSPQPSIAQQRLTDANLKALDASHISKMTSPPSPIEEDSEPRTPLKITSPRKWKFS